MNVVGLCRGDAVERHTRRSSSAAHYDHVGIRNGETYVGADDNASGTTALLALASLCKKAPWQHDIVFVAFDAEEQGLQGARAFVGAPPIPKERIALNINMDMVSRSATREIYIAGTGYYPALRKPLEDVVKRSDATVRFGHDGSDGKKGRDDWTMQSDHGAFHAAGIPFLYFGVEDHPDYHKPTDTIEKVNPAFFFHVVATILDALNTLDRSLPSLGQVRRRTTAAAAISRSVSTGSTTSSTSPIRFPIRSGSCGGSSALTIARSSASVPRRWRLAGSRAC